MTIVNDKDINRVNGADENYVEEIDTMSREYLSDWFGVVFSLNTSQQWLNLQASCRICKEKH